VKSGYAAWIQLTNRAGGGRVENKWLPKRDAFTNPRLEKFSLPR